MADLEAAGKTVVIVAADGVPAGILALADQLRPGAADTVAELTALTGTAPVLLTGDNARAATTLADADRNYRHPRRAAAARQSLRRARA